MSKFKLLARSFSLLVFIILAGCGGSESTPVSDAAIAPPVVTPNLIEVLISGPIDQGNFDPAPTVDESGALWMSYSHVSIDVSGIKLIETRLANSGDGGSNWQDVLNINTPVLSIIGSSQTTTTHEVSRLVYNPFASAVGADPWILLWHRYLSLLDGSDTLRLFEHGWIGMKSGATASSLGSQRKLFTGSVYNTVNNADSLGAPDYTLNTIDSALSECLTFSEPGVLPKSSGVYVALLCATASPPGKIVLLRCDHFMNNCSYLGDLLNGSEAKLLDSSYDNFSAAELVSVNGNDFLIVTPSASTIYRGCIVYKITDIDLATIERLSGEAKPTAIFEASGDFNGACGYVSGLTGSGVIMSKAFFNSSPAFRLFTTGYQL